MPQRGLVVADDGVVPIGDVEGAVGTGADIDGAKAAVIGPHEWGMIGHLMSGILSKQIQAMNVLRMEKDKNVMD